MQFLAEQSEFDEGEDFETPPSSDRFLLGLIVAPLLFVAAAAAAISVFNSEDQIGSTEAASERVSAVGTEQATQSELAEQPLLSYEQAQPEMFVEGTVPSGVATSADGSDLSGGVLSGADSTGETALGDTGEGGQVGGVGEQTAATTSTTAGPTTTRRTTTSRQTTTTRRTTTSRQTTTTGQTTTSRQTTTTQQTTTAAPATTAAPTTAAPTTAAPTTAAPTTTTAPPTTTTTAPPTTAPPTTSGNSCASNSEFERILRDDFNGSSVSGNWNQYYSTGNAGYGLRRPSANSVSDGVLTITAKMENGSLVSGGMSSNINQKYGKYVARVRTDQDPSKATSGVLLTWPTSNVHPRDGENNFYETLVDEGMRNPFYTFIHKPYGSKSDQEYKEHHADGSSYQIMTMEWTPSRVTIKREGPGGSSYTDVWTVNETSADLVPDVSHYMTIQLDAWSHSIGDPVRMQVDYVEIYKYCG